MVKHIVFRIVAGLVLLAAIAGLGFFAYQAGVAHGVAANIQVPAAETAESPYLFHGMPYGPFMWFPGFGGCFVLLIPLFLLFLAFGAMRRMIWGPRWGMRHMRHGPLGHGPWGEGVPPMFAEMHRRAHMSPQGGAAEAGEQPADKKPEG
jgi:hypothetical protein